MKRIGLQSAAHFTVISRKSKKMSSFLDPSFKQPLTSMSVNVSPRYRTKGELLSYSRVGRNSVQPGRLQLFPAEAQQKNNHVRRTAWCFPFPPFSTHSSSFYTFFQKNFKLIQTSKTSCTRKLKVSQSYGFLKKRLHKKKVGKESIVSGRRICDLVNEVQGVKQE